MTRKLLLYVTFGLFGVLSHAQNNTPTALDQLSIQCKQIIDLNDTINARQVRLDDLKSRLEEIRLSWWQTCNDALSSSSCDEYDTRLNTIDELMSLTDPKFESDIFSQLKEARNNPAIRTLNPIGQSTPASSRMNSSNRRDASRNGTTPPREKSTKSVERGEEESDAKDKDGVVNDDVVVNPVVEWQPKEEQGMKKDNSSTSPDSKDSKKNPEKQVEPVKQEKQDHKDKTKIESNDETNRNKTINTVKDKCNKNK